MRRKLGQHFLHQKTVLERMARAACPEDESLIIEIGPGQGALTEYLLRRARRLIAIEIDPALAEGLAARFAGEPRLSVLRADVLDVDLAQWGPAVAAGNLPYYVATPILELVVRLPAIRRSTFLIQKEVAERVCARPGERAYGYLTLHLQLFADCEILFEVKPGAFRPPPEVDSAAVRLTRHERAAALGVADPDAFLRFLAQCFRHKRKTLRNNLAGTFPRSRVDALPEAPLRAEQIPLEQFAQIYRHLVP